MAVNGSNPKRSPGCPCCKSRQEYENHGTNSWHRYMPADKRRQLAARQQEMEAKSDDQVSNDDQA